MKFTFVLQLDPYQIDATEKDGVLALSSPGNEMYRTVDWATVPERGDRIMIDNDQVPDRFAMVGFWCEVDSRSYRRDGIQLVNLSPAWPREKPLPEEDGWTDVAPWLEPVEIETRLDGQGRRVFVGFRQGGMPVPPEQWPKTDATGPVLDGGWYLYPALHLPNRRGGIVAEKYVRGKGGIEVMGLNKTKEAFYPQEYSASGWWWWVVNHGKVVGYRPFVVGENPPLDWADKCLSGGAYKLNPEGEPTFVWAEGARLTDARKV